MNIFLCTLFPAAVNAHFDSIQAENDAETGYKITSNTLF